MANIICRIEVDDGVIFQLTAELADGEVCVRCAPQDSRYLPLCGVVETAFRYSPVRLLKAVQERHGQSFEGEVSFAYYHDYPDELEPGVTVDYLGDELVVSEEKFRRFVVAFVTFFMKARREFLTGSGLDEDGLTPMLAALNE